MHVVNACIVNSVCVFVEINWGSHFSLKARQMYVSLPGVFNEIVINMRTRVHPRNTFISVTLNKFLGDEVQHAVECIQEQQHYCILFLPKSQEMFTLYYLFGNMHEYYNTPNTLAFLQSFTQGGESRKLISWNTAANLCRSVGAYLPYFTKRSELDELLHLMRQSPYIPILQAVYIGLHYNKTKVSWYVDEFHKYHY